MSDRSSTGSPSAVRRALRHAVRPVLGLVVLACLAVPIAASTGSGMRTRAVAAQVQRTAPRYLEGPIAPSRVEATIPLQVYGRMSSALEPDEQPVKVVAYQYVGGAWRYRFARTAVNPTPTTYAARMRIPDAGRWRLVARHYDGGHRTVSPSHTLTAWAPTPLDHVRALAGPGPRVAGSAGDARGRDYLASQLTRWGYSVRQQLVYLPNGRTTRNVIATKAGLVADEVVIGAHHDSKWPSPGANDNASGCAVTLELARRAATREFTPTITFVFFGGEEMSGGGTGQHHFGSRQYVRALSASRKARIAGMIDIDMVGVGAKLHTRTLGVAPRTLERSLRSRASSLGYTMTYLKDPSSSGWSDHEAFEFAGIPVAWLEWRDDPRYHTTGDRPEYCSSWRMGWVANIVDTWLELADRSVLDGLR